MADSVASAGPGGAPLRLFYFDGFANFGDRIAHDIVAAVSGRPVVASPPGEADLFALGSIMRQVAKVTKQPRAGGKPAVWGSGIMGLQGPEVRVDNIHFAAVRGPLTQTLLDLGPIALGDPGLLITDVVAPVPRGERIGVLCHVSDKPAPETLERLRADGRFDLIAVGTEDHLATVRAIAACGHVVSSSLHGLIVADAYGVPNTWMVNSRIHTGGAFKFHDYALSVRRLLNVPVRLEDLPGLADAGAFGTATPAHFDQVQALKDPLRAAFPHDHLRALAAAEQKQVA